MADVLDLIPLYQETATTVRARMDADVNAGLSEDDPNWLDTREGSFYYDVTQPFVLEISRLWDAIGSEVIAAAMPVLAWGTYLEQHAAVFGIQREAAIAASGQVTFTGDAATVVAVATIVSADPVNEDDDTAVEFVTVESGTTGAQLLPPDPVSATLGSGGGLLAGTYNYSVTARNAFGETTGTVDLEVDVLTNGSTVILDWPDVAGATSYSVYRGFEDGQKYLVASPTASTYTDTGTHSALTGPPDINTTAGVTLDVVAQEAGTIGNVPAFAVTSIDSPNPGINSVYNATAMTGGAEIEDDESLRGKVLARYAGQGGGNITDYEQWTLSVLGVGRVTVIPLASGPGTVGIVAMTADGSPVSSTVLSATQAYLDPVAQQGKGRAPIGHNVIVSTPTTLLLDIQAHLTLATGYSLDGAGNTTNVAPDVFAAVANYVNALGVGDDVVIEHAKAQFFKVPGVVNISGVQIGVHGGALAAADLVVSATQVARLNLITYT